MREALAVRTVAAEAAKYSHQEIFPENFLPLLVQAKQWTCFLKKKVKN